MENTNEILDKIISYVKATTHVSDEYAPGMVDAEYLIEYIETLKG